MPPKKFTLHTTSDHHGKRLDQVLAEWLPRALGQPVSKAQGRKLVIAGAVYLNGRRTRIASKPILQNAKIDAYVDLGKLNTGGRAADRPFEMTEREILFEDDWLIAVNKPPGLPTQPTLDEARDNLFGALKAYLAKREGKPVYVGLHHRLDRDTSGVVLFTKDASVNAAVSELFAKHVALKTYQALGAKPPGRVPGEWTVKNYLARAKGSGKKARFTAVRSGGDFAWTDFRKLEELGRALLIEAKPKTGRTHQIRVHLAEEGIPILGDATYAPEAVRKMAPRLMLHAASLTFPHPVNRTEMKVQSPLPEDFKQCLHALQKGL